MKIDDKIILYLDNQLSEKEKAEFENELDKSEELKQQLIEYKKFMSSFAELDNVEVDERYFAANIPKFREKLERKKKFAFIPRISIALSTIVAIFLIFMFVLNNKSTNNVTSLSSLIENANQNDLRSVIDNYTSTLNLSDASVISNISNTSVDSVINQSYYKELNLSNTELEKYLSSENIDYDNLISGLGTSQKETLYKELENKKYF